LRDCLRRRRRSNKPKPDSPRLSAISTKPTEPPLLRHRQ
jgi:hypothetical protein